MRWADMENHKLINKALLVKYGKDIAGYPMYRLVQNGRALTEKRIGDFRIYYGHIFLREEHGCLEVPKYNYIPDGRWILEKLFYTDNPELTTQRTYEPMHVFELNGEYQRPNYKACEFLIESALKGPSKALAEEEFDEKEVAMFYEMLGGKPGIEGSPNVSYSGLDATSKIKEL